MAFKLFRPCEDPVPSEWRSHEASELLARCLSLCSVSLCRCVGMWQTVLAPEVDAELLCSSS